MKAEYINPFVSATEEVFLTMLQCKLSRGELYTGDNSHPAYEVSGVIGLSGKASGTVVISVDSNVAISLTEAMLGERPEEVDADVVDALGEVTNIVAGKAKSGLEQFAMSLSLPTVITGKNHLINFGSTTPTIGIPYTCPWGDLTVEVGLVENEE